ncbi:MAG: hypothetical protein LBU36_00480 [Clostridiales bacterium]|nr:hypothetical protein [Clostridiales bacterium]
MSATESSELNLQKIAQELRATARGMTLSEFCRYVIQIGLEIANGKMSYEELTKLILKCKLGDDVDV